MRAAKLGFSWSIISWKLIGFTLAPHLAKLLLNKLTVGKEKNHDITYVFHIHQEHLDTKGCFLAFVTLGYLRLPYNALTMQASSLLPRSGRWRAPAASWPLASQRGTPCTGTSDHGTPPDLHNTMQRPNKEKNILHLLHPTSIHIPESKNSCSTCSALQNE